MVVFLTQNVVFIGGIPYLMQILLQENENL